MRFSAYHKKYENTGRKMKWQDTGAMVLAENRFGQVVSGPAYSHHFLLMEGARLHHDILRYQFECPASDLARAAMAEIEEDEIMNQKSFMLGDLRAAEAEILRDAAVWRQIEKQQDQRAAARDQELKMKATKCGGPCGSIDCARGCIEGAVWTGSYHDTLTRGLNLNRHPGPITMEEPERTHPGLVDSRAEQQPSPVANAHPAIWPLVIGEMAKRDHMGRQRYGAPLQPHNGRDMLRDAYEEVLDLAVYLRGAIYERDGK